MKNFSLSCWLHLFYAWFVLYQCTPIEVKYIESLITESRSASSFQIVGVFSNSLHFHTSSQECSIYTLRDIQFTQAMIYAIQTLINNNSKLLPDINLGWTIIDSCSSRELAV